MKTELLKMYKYPSMIKTMGFCAASFALLSVLFKTGIVLIPEVSEVRICNALACSYGIWFGPAGAWGCALGNLVGDLGGSFTILTPFGFIANFLSAWFPYRIWISFDKPAEGDSFCIPSMKNSKWLLRYFACSVGSVVPCCATLALSFDYFGSMSAVKTFIMIFCNNMAASLVGILLFACLCKISAMEKLYWPVQMEIYSNGSDKSSEKSVIPFLILSFLICVFTVVCLSVMKSAADSDQYCDPLTFTVYGIYLLVSILGGQFKFG